MTEHLDPSTATTVLGLLRHGQTDWNIEYRLQGVTDIPLNETGLQQARSAAGRINPRDWDVVLSSPLSRALDTARIVVDDAGFTATEIVVSPLLLERSFGEAEGALYAEWKANHGGDPVGGESREQLTARVLECLGWISRQFAGKRVLAVSHGAFIREALGLASAGVYPPEGERIGNACLNVFAAGADGAWRVERYSPEPLA